MTKPFTKNFILLYGGYVEKNTARCRAEQKNIRFRYVTICNT